MKTTEQYLNNLPQAQRSMIESAIDLIREHTPPDTLEKMAYGMPSWHYGTYLIHVGAFKNHLGLYPGPGAIEACQTLLSGLKTSKGSIQVPWDVPLPVELIKALIHYNLHSPSQ
jgi:uncharacterized protein YdhG (YjbR/CyaY superfamily)